MHVLQNAFRGLFRTDPKVFLIFIRPGILKVGSLQAAFHEVLLQFIPDEYVQRISHFVGFRPYEPRSDGVYTFIIAVKGHVLQLFTELFFEHRPDLFPESPGSSQMVLTEPGLGFMETRADGTAYDASFVYRIYVMSEPGMPGFVYRGKYSLGRIVRPELRGEPYVSLADEGGERML